MNIIYYLTIICTCDVCLVCFVVYNVIGNDLVIVQVNVKAIIAHICLIIPE